MNSVRINISLKDVVVVFIIEVAIIIGIAISFRGAIESNPYIFVLIVSVVMMVIMGGLIIIRKQAVRELGIVREKAIIYAIAGIPLGVVVFVLMGHITQSAAYTHLINKISIPAIILSLISIPTSIIGVSSVILVPIEEELLFRGMLYQVMRMRNNKRAVSIIVVSMLFAILHLNFTGEVIFRRFIYSCIITYVFERYRNLLICISFHSTINYLALLPMYTW